MARPVLSLMFLAAVIGEAAARSARLEVARVLLARAAQLTAAQPRRSGSRSSGVSAFSTEALVFLNGLGFRARVAAVMAPTAPTMLPPPVVGATTACAARSGFT